MKNNAFLKLWLTPKFPDKHIENLFSYKPEGLKNQLRNYYRTWVFHPIRRRTAKYYLFVLRKFFGLKVVGITGSAGKTTTKEMLAAVLKEVGPTIFSYANIDPVYNIPTTILRCSPRTKFLVLEMGVEFPGEMDFYTWLAKPDIGVITNIYRTHTEFFGDENGVFKEKSRLVRFLSENDYAVLNFENKYLKSLEGKLKSEIIWFGKGSDIHSSEEKLTKEFQTQFNLNYGDTQEKVYLRVLGYSYIFNALAVAAVCKALGLNLKIVKKGLGNFKPAPHRMDVLTLQSGAVVIDDSYNSNPEAAKAAVSVFADIAGGREKIIVFGDMKELGGLERDAHRELGTFIAENAKPDFLICVGKAAKETSENAAKILGNNVAHVEFPADVLPLVQSKLKKNSLILVKGSRSIGLDKFVEELRAAL